MTKEQALEITNKVVADFDFKKAHQALVGCKWGFFEADTPPSIEWLREKAKSLVFETVLNGYLSSGQGPLEARRSNEGHSAVESIVLTLQVVRASEEYVDQEAMVKHSAKIAERKKAKLKKAERM